MKSGTGSISPDIAGIYTDLRLHLKSKGAPIPANDLWIASLALHLGLPILSNDAHCDHIPHLDRIPF